MKGIDKFTSQWYGATSANGTEAPYHPRTTRVFVFFCAENDEMWSSFSVRVWRDRYRGRVYFFRHSFAFTICLPQISEYVSRLATGGTHTQYWLRRRNNDGNKRWWRCTILHPQVIDVTRSYVPLENRMAMRDYWDRTLPTNASRPFIRESRSEPHLQCFAQTWGEGWTNNREFLRRENPAITAAGQPSGMPVPLNAFEKFGRLIENWDPRITGERNGGPFTMYGNNQAGAFMTRYRTMKYDTRKNLGAALDVPFRYCPSDYTGFPRRYLAAEGYSKYGKESLVV
ncbi:unnamed protein product [Amoebophrya sp. A120]|nr:unnamed protein product [Amoebophrya sp. A120]|eukprot:GSA120T00000973001.1